MTKITVKLDTIDSVYAFVAAATKAECEIDIISGKYLVNAKSVMGLFSLDLRQPIEVHIHADNCDELLAEFAPFKA